MQSNNVLIVENLYPLQTRSYRIEMSLKKYGFNVDSIMWNRNGVEITPITNHYIYTKVSRNKIRKLCSIWFYYKYLKNVIKKRSYDIIIASHWDMLFLCSLIKNKNQALIYDNLDMPTHKYKFIRKLFKLIELFSLRKTNGNIYASRFFKEFYSKEISSLTLENKPLKVVMDSFDKSYISKNNITVSFFGTLRYIESLKILMDVVGSMENVNLIIKGSGFADDLISYKNNKNYSNVTVDVGWYNYADLGKLYTVTDIVWAAYPSMDFNVKYAISNKFFESLIFNKPCIFSDNTMLGVFVKNNNIGLTTNPYSYKSIKNLFLKIMEHKEVLHVIKENQKKINQENIFWEEEEENLISFLNNIVLKVKAN